MQMMKMLIRIIFVLIIGVFGYKIGILDISIRNEAINHAAHALDRTGLSAEYAPEYSLYGFVGFRDFFSQTKFQVYDEIGREALLSEIAVADIWRIAKVTGEEYREFQQLCMWNDVLDVPEDIEFDAWYYCETDEPSPYSEYVLTGTSFSHCRFYLFADTNAPVRRLNLHKSNAVNERLAD